jgi:hypothetical protein
MAIPGQLYFTLIIAYVTMAYLGVSYRSMFNIRGSVNSVVQMTSCLKGARFKRSDPYQEPNCAFRVL